MPCIYPRRCFQPIRAFSRLLEDFITRIDDQGFLSTQGAQVIISTATNACPLLASLCLMLYEINPEAMPLQRVFRICSGFDVGWFKTPNRSMRSSPHGRCRNNSSSTPGYSILIFGEKPALGLIFTAHTAQPWQQCCFEKPLRLKSPKSSATGLLAMAMTVG